MPLNAETHSEEASAYETWTTDAGDQLAYDGVFYSFRSPDGKSAFKVWTPPQDEPIRGLLLFGNPGGGYGGDTRDKSRQRDMLEFAARKGIAVAGVTGFPGRDTYTQYGEYILRGLKAMGERGHHPELAEIPFIATGGSNAGAFSYSMMCLAPSRAIGITPNVGSYFDLDAPAEAHEVPVWIHIGALDPLSNQGVEKTEELFRTNAAQEGHLFWTWDAEMKSHENGGADHVDFAFWETILDLRLPDTITPGEPVELRKLDFESGWAADFDTWDHRITRVFPASELPENPEAGRYGWLPNEAMARLYQANATRSRPIILELAEQPKSQAAGTSGVYLSAGLSTIVSPGQKVRLRVTKVPLAFGINEVGIYDRGEKLGTIKIDEEEIFEFTVDGDKAVYSLYAYTTQSGWREAERISAPLQLLVRDPEVSERLEKQLATHELENSAKRFAEAPRKPSSEIPSAPYADNVLAAAKLDSSSNLSRDGKVSPVWEKLKVSALSIGSDYTVESEEAEATDTEFEVKAAWSDKGLYLLYTVSDHNSAEASQEDILADSVDFHLASVNPERVLESDGVPLDVYAKPGDTSLLSTATQYQVSTRQDGTIMVNFWDPWDPRSTRWNPEDNYAGSGMWADVVELSENRNAVEVFVPWHLVGKPGFSSAPQAGTRITTMIGYNDSGSNQKLAWPASLDPWRQAPEEGKPAYGQIVLLP